MLEDEREQLSNKLDMEWQNFYFAQLSGSKANLFSNSDYISKKRKISFLLRKKCKRMPDDVIHRLLFLDNIIDETDRFCDDHPELSLDKSVQKFLETFLKSEF